MHRYTLQIIHKKLLKYLFYDQKKIFKNYLNYSTMFIEISSDLNVQQKQCSLFITSNNIFTIIMRKTFLGNFIHKT